MKALTLALFAVAMAASAQQPTKTKASDAPKAAKASKRPLSASFVKAALLALKSIERSSADLGQDSKSDELIDAADAEANPKSYEGSVVIDLRGFLMFKDMNNLTRRVNYQLGKSSEEIDKRESACFSRYDVMLRTRAYQPVDACSDLYVK